MKQLSDAQLAALAALADLLAAWCDTSDERLAALFVECVAWGEYYTGVRSEKPLREKTGTPLRDSDYHVFCEALWAVRMGLASKAGHHAGRVQRRMGAGNPLKVRLAPGHTPPPQVRDGKDGDTGRMPFEGIGIKPPGASTKPPFASRRKIKQGMRVSVAYPGSPDKHGVTTSDENRDKRVGVSFDDKTWGYVHVDFVAIV